VPGLKNGPIGVRTPYKLGGTKKEGKGGNKTQAVVLHLISQLLRPPNDSGYYVFLNNLFISTQFVKYARAQGIAVTSTYRDTGGVI
jgi:hypothetical protein